jgi:hypothetical protein
VRVEARDAAARMRIVRVLVGAYAAVWLAVRLPYHLDLTGFAAARWSPVGVLAPFDRPPPAGLAGGVALVAIPLAVGLAAGWRPRVVAPLCAVAILLVTTYASSWGQLFHTENLLVLHVAILAAAALARRPDPALVLRLLAVVTATTYVVTGVAKLRVTGWDWVTGDVLRDQVAYDNLRKALLGAPYSPIGARAVGHGWLFPPLAAVTLLVELGAPVVLLGRRLATGWSAAAWVFHVGVLGLMAIAFPYHLSGVAFAAALPVERLRAPNLLRRWTASSSPSPSPPLP